MLLTSTNWIERSLIAMLGILTALSLLSGTNVQAGDSPEFEIGETIYENPLSSPEDIEDWVIESSKEGHPAITFPHGMMRLESDVHFLLWCPKDFPDNIAVSWDFQPRVDNGLAMFWIAATGKDGKDLFDPSLPERKGRYGKDYRKGAINALHVAYFRRNAHVRPYQIVSLRKSTVHDGGPVKARRPDPIPSVRTVQPKYKQPYRMQVIKYGPYFWFSIYDHVKNTNRVIIDWKDEGEGKAPILEGGKIGFRQMAGLTADYANLKVQRVSLADEE